MRRKRAPGSQGASAEARAKVAHKKEGDFSSDGPSRKIVHKSILDWDLLNKPDSVMGQSFTFVTVMYIFTISSYVYWLMINKMSSFTNVVFRTVVNGVSVFARIHAVQSTNPVFFQIDAGVL